MRPLLPLVVLSLAGLGCPGRQFLQLDVADAARRPLPGAVATAVCAPGDSSAARTDPHGRARLTLAERQRDKPCTLTVARPGNDTARFEVDRFCDTADCRPIAVELGGDR